MSLLRLLLGGWRLVLGGLLAGALVAGPAVWWLRDQMAARQALQQAQHSLRTLQRQGQATTRVETRYLRGAERVRTVTRTIIQEVPHVVTHAVDRAYGALPLGLVRLYDASGEGRELSAVPDPAGRADDAPSGLLPSAFAAIAADNNGAANECRAQVSALQDWIRAQARVR
jgi:hypothetical protein